LNSLAEVGEQTPAEFRKRRDNWLMTVDKTRGWGPTNHRGKWFQVCEHESTTMGRSKFLGKRLPGARPSKEQEL